MRGRGLGAGRRRRKLTNNEVKAFLNRARWIERQIRADEEHVAQLRRSLGGDFGIDYSKQNSVHGGAPHDFTDTIAVIVDYETTLTARRREKIEALRRISEIIDKVDDERLRLLLSLRYRNLLPWEKVAGEMGYAWSQVHRFHRLALTAVKKIVEGEKMIHNDT